jgi:outer membrane protein OmpA-like peptidoglycan-associated protein
MKPYLALLLAGCASGPPSELPVAREAYAITTTSADVDPASLLAARTALDQAERSYKHQGSTPGTRTLSYVAEREVESAQSTARQLSLQRTIKRTEHDIATAGNDALREGVRLPTTTDGALVYAAGALQRSRTEQQTALRAEGEIVDGLHHVGHTKEHPGGFDITIPAPRLFLGDDTLLAEPTSAELDAVAIAIVRTAPRDTVTIESHADTGRGDAIDRYIAQKRANAVADYLSERGVSRTQIHALGLPPVHWDPDAAALHGLERSIKIRVTYPSPETP